MKKPRIFISHCEKNMAPTEYAKRIIELLGCDAVIAEKQPKRSNTVHEVVMSNMDSCDAVVVIATCDLPDGANFSPSKGVSGELAILKSHEKWKHKYFVIIQEGVVLSPMDDSARYKFKDDNFSTIAEAILVELGSWDLFRNYFEMPGSESEIHKLMEVLSAFKVLAENETMDKEEIKKSVRVKVDNFMNKYLGES